MFLVLILIYGKYNNIISQNITLIRFIEVLNSNFQKSHFKLVEMAFLISIASIN